MRTLNCSICPHKGDIEDKGFFSYPTQPKKLKLWMESLGMTEKPKPNHKVCFQHFEKRDLHFTARRSSKSSGKCKVTSYLACLHVFVILKKEFGFIRESARVL